MATETTVVEHGRPKFINDLMEALGEPLAHVWVDVPEKGHEQKWAWYIEGKFYQIAIHNQSRQFGHYVTTVHGYGVLTLESARYPTYAQLRSMCHIAQFPEGTEPQVEAPQETPEIPLDATPQT